jgi:diaminohydroxyphosphoribosylaminopyrimidine deaminase/5-amino-6-(5-phosphoribosylamino)uracil reductase
VDLKAVVARLGALGGNEILLEAGPILAGAMLQAGLVDEVVMYQAPKWLGSSARPLAHMAIDRLADSIEMDYREISRVGPDLRIIAVPVHRIPASTAS